MRRDSGDYTHHLENPSGPDAPKEFTYSDAIWLVIEGINYLLGWCIQVSIVAQVFGAGGDDPADDRAFYLFYFLLPHIAAGLKNMQYHYKESNEEDDEDGLGGWISVLLFFPFSPIYRMIRAWRYGLDEKNDWENGVRFVDEMVTVGVLRLFDIFLGDLPTLVLLVRDDVLSRSDDWASLFAPPVDPLTCGGLCSQPSPSTLDFWTIFRMFLILSKMAEGITFYIAMTKRLQRLQYPDHYNHLKGKNSKQGRMNALAIVILYSAQFFIIGSRIMGYSLLSQAFGAWVYLIIGLRWLIHTAWHLLSLLNTHGITPARSVSSFVMGGVWLIALTNEEGGRQLGRFALYYGIAIGESLICAFLWNGNMKGSGDYFAVKGSWAIFVMLGIGMLLHALYYALLHPGTPSITKDGLRCCTGDRQDPEASDDDDNEEAYQRNNDAD